jgi:hypothetical protein
MRSILLSVFLVACGPGLSQPDQPGSADAGSVQQGCGGANGCYTVYAHSNNVLYLIDLEQKSLVRVGAFNAPSINGHEDVITDLAVSPSDDIYVVSHTTLYTASPTDGHVTKIGDLSTCGQDNVALSFASDGTLYVADYKGAFCRIDGLDGSPTVTPIGSGIGHGMAISGDLVAVADGTMFGTAYYLSDSSSSGSQMDNLLVEIDPQSGTIVRVIGKTDYPKLFGASFALGQVFGFTHDGSGEVITIDPATGHGSLFGTFQDPSTGKGIAFAGAGVNANVPLIQ